MIIWGGFSPSATSTGGRYNPNSNSWVNTGDNNAPSGRVYHTAIWTGSEMIVWGGQDENFRTVNTGGKYSPGTDSWVATSVINAPAGRASHTAVWSGGEMLVRGGVDDKQN